MKNYLIVSDTAKINGGGAKVAIETARCLADEGFNVTFFAGGGENDELLDHKNINVINLGLSDLLTGGKLRMFSKGFYNKKVYKQFLAFLKSINLENTVIHIHSWVKTLTCSIFKALRKVDKEFYITAHDYFLLCPNGGYFIYPKNVICHNKKGVKCLLCNCDSRSYLIKIWRYFRFKKQSRLIKKCKYKVFSLSPLMLEQFKNNKFDSHILKNPIDLNDKKLDLPKSRPDHFVYIGRLSKEKGIDTMCEAIIKSGFNCHIYGDGPIKDQLMKKYADFKNIVFGGWKPFNEIKPRLNEYTALIFPSVWFEGAPLTIPEVQSYGLPCIVSDACSGKDYIYEGLNGYVFKAKDVDMLCECLNRISSLSDDDYLKLRESTYDIALKENYNRDTYAKVLIEELK